MAKLSLNIEAVMKLESHVSSSYAALSCLQTDFNTVLEKCSKIDMLVDEIAALKISLAPKDGGLPLPKIDTAVPEDNPQDDTNNSSLPESSDDSTSCDGDVESAAEEIAAYREAPRPAPRHKVNDRKIVPAAVPAKEERRKMTDGGFTYVEIARKNVERKNTARVYTNSALKSKQKKQDFVLKTVHRKSSESSSYSAVFVSNFTPDTKPAEISAYLLSKYERQFKVVQIPGKFKDCVSFKIVTHDTLKGALLNRNNWAPGVYVREFYENAGGVVRLPNH